MPGGTQTPCQMSDLWAMMVEVEVQTSGESTWIHPRWSPQCVEVHHYHSTGPISKLRFVREPLLPEANRDRRTTLGLPHEYIDLVTPRSPTSYDIFPLPEEWEGEGMIVDEVADKAAFQE